MKLVLSLIVVAAMAVGASASDVWITADFDGAHADATVQVGASFDLFVFVDPTVRDPGLLEELRMWTGLTVPGIAQFTAVEILEGVEQSTVIFPDEVMYGAIEMGLVDPAPFARLSLEALAKGQTGTASMPVRSEPGGVAIVSEADINVIPEPATMTMVLILGVAFGLIAIRRR